MIIITNLKGSPAVGEVKETRGTISALHLEPVKGFFVKVQLGEAGVTIRRGNDVVVVPTAELLALAQPHLSELKVLKKSEPKS